MSIKTLWKKLFGKKEEEVVFSIDEKVPDLPKPIAPPPIIDVSHKRAVEMKKGREGRETLTNAFYGTLVNRAPDELGYPHRKKHLHDGWRDGKSHPIEFKGKTYDVIKKFNGKVDADQTRDQFEHLMKLLNEMAGE